MVHKDICQIKIKNVDGLSYEEFYNLLKDLKKRIKESQKDKDINVKHYTKLVHFVNSKQGLVIKANREQIVKSNNQESLLKVLELMFGESFYETKEFNNIFQISYHLQIPNRMQFINKPNNKKEVQSLLASFRDILNSNDLGAISKVNISLNFLSAAIEQSAFQVLTLSEELNKIYKAINSILNACDKNEQINIDELDYICKLINKNIFFEIAATKEIEKLKVGDCLAEFVNGYNQAILPIAEQKDYEKKFKEYYRKIIKTNFNHLDNSDLPDYNDPKFLIYMREILKTMEQEPVKDMEYCKRYAVASMHYGLYFRNKNK